jgi:hypothetical protein
MKHKEEIIKALSRAFEAGPNCQWVCFYVQERYRFFEDMKEVLSVGKDSVLISHPLYQGGQLIVFVGIDSEIDHIINQLKIHAINIESERFFSGQ